MYGYDTLGRVQTIATDYGYMIGYAYDNSGNVVTKNDVGASTITTYTYDNVNRLVKERLNTVSYDYTFSYDKYNNLSGSTTEFYKDCIYDNNNRLTSMTLVGEQIDNVTYDYEYDYSYDNNGNMTGSSYTYDVFNDATGTLVSRDNTNQASYTYDVWGRMTHSDSVDDRNNVNYATNIIGVTGIEARKQGGTTGFFVKDMHGDVRGAYTSTGTELANYVYGSWRFVPSLEPVIILSISISGDDT